MTRAANLSLSVDVLKAAEQRDVASQEQERRWRADHADFVAVYNATVETEGLPLEVSMRMNFDDMGCQQADWDARSRAAQDAAAQAWCDSGQIRRIAKFLAGTYDGHPVPFDLLELRAVEWKSPTTCSRASTRCGGPRRICTRWCLMGRSASRRCARLGA